VNLSSDPPVSSALSRREPRESGCRGFAPERAFIIGDGEQFENRHRRFRPVTPRRQSGDLGNAVKAGTRVPQELPSIRADHGIA
jgi:hypothetical protein